MNEKAKATNLDAGSTKNKSQGKFTRLHALGILLTIAGLALFVYFVYSVGVYEILEGILRIGISGFLIILLGYFVRILIRAFAWKICVNEPYKLSIFDTLQAVIIGEALSSMIPLGILISGTAKAVAVRRRVPLVVAFSSIATENLFYSLGTGLFMAFGAIAFLKTFDLAEGWVLIINSLIALVFILIILGFVMVFRQWHFASAVCQKVYEYGFLTKILEHGRFQMREFENQIYGFYRKYPGRFVPIFLMQVVFHALGVFEAWFILTKISDIVPTIYTSFLLESISRAITVVFKLVPFLIGVDEAGARYVTETLALGAGLGVTLAIIRKGRILFWTALGIIMILKREFSVTDILHQADSENDQNVISQSY